MKTPITYYGGKQNMVNIILPLILKDKNLKLQDIFYAFHNKGKTFIIKKSDLL